MRHRKANVKLGRTASHREAMLRNMVTSLFEYGRINTTVSKAKALRPLADRLIGLAKAGKANLHALRQAAAVITKRPVLDKLFNEAAGRFGDRSSGYTLMAKTGLRPGDAAPMVLLELTGTGRGQAVSGGRAKSRAGGAGDRAKRVAASARKDAAAVPAAAVPAAPVPAGPVPAEEAPGEKPASAADPDSTGSGA